MIDIGKREEEVLRYWNKNEIAKRVKHKNEHGKKFFFLEGPPFVTGPPAAHHIWVYTIKDIMLRYKRYRGFAVHDRAGFDIHGLPTENKVERALNISSKRDIEEKVGVEAFIEKCKEFSEENVEKALQIAPRFGISLDFNDRYSPSSIGYMNAAWGIFKRIYDKGLIYKDLEPLFYCPHCGTVVSSGGEEIEYANDSDPSLYVRFKINTGKPSRLELKGEVYLLVWTTTPWTLPANMMIAANHKAMYVNVRIGNESYIVAKDRLDAVLKGMGQSGVIVSEFYGTELEGMSYASPLEALVPMQKSFAKYHKVILDENLVSTTEGTGLVHIAPGHGSEDYKVTRKYKTPIFSPVNESAKYTQDAGRYGGLTVPEEANAAVLDDLKRNGDLLFVGKITHSYPHCWRCDTKLITRATEQWFMNVQKLKKKLVAANQKVVWHPANAKDWQTEAFESSPDWCISRQRYWGITIPVWICEQCGNVEVMGSSGELASRAKLNAELKDMYKQHVDEISFKCAKCGGESHRIKDIFDGWYESGVAHTASLSAEEFARLFPADWVTESRDQIRGWFSTLMRTSVAVYGKSPFGEVTIGGILFDSLGQEMHKHLGNVIDSDMLLKMASADGYRLWCSSFPRWFDAKVRKDEIAEADRNIMTLYNVSLLVKEFVLLSGIDARVIKKPSASRLENEDAWIISRLNSLIKDVTEMLDGYRIDEAVDAIRNFILEDYSRFYLKFAKQRAATAKKSELKRIASLNSYILYNTVILSSIIIPFSSEFIYQELFSTGNSIFECGWPKCSKAMVNENVEKDFMVFKEVATAILNLREKEKIQLRRPLQSATIETNDEYVMDTVQKLSLPIEQYANVMELKCVKAQRSSKTIRPVFAKIGPDFKNFSQSVAAELANADAEAVQSSIKNTGGYQLHTSDGTFTITDKHFVVVEKPMAENVLQFKHGTLTINTELNESIKEELTVRELSRNIQSIRKEMGLTKLDKVDVLMLAQEDLEKAVMKNADRIKSTVKARSIKASESRLNEEHDGIIRKEIEILGTPVKVGLIKVEKKKEKD